MTSTMMQIGNSIGVIVPAEIRKKAKLSKGHKVEFDVDSEGRIIIYKFGKNQNKTSITPEFIEIVNRVNKRYKEAFRELAGK